MTEDARCNTSSFSLQGILPHTLDHWNPTVSLMWQALEIWYNFSHPLEHVHVTKNFKYLHFIALSVQLTLSHQYNGLGSAEVQSD